MIEINESELNNYRTSSDIAAEIGNQLEDANHHSISSAPKELHRILAKYIDEYKLKQVFIDIMNDRVFGD